MPRPTTDPGTRRQGRGRRSAPEPPEATPEEVAGWFAGSLPDDWFTEPVQVWVDRDEVLVRGRLPEPTTSGDASAEVAEAARIEAFREDTRAARIAVARRAEARFGRKVSWGASCGGTTADFTTAHVPAMTRLRFDQRATLDTLIDAGVARSRSEALAWCVDLVAEHEAEWIGALRDALSAVEEARRRGPGSS